MGRRVLQHHIWGYAVCLCPIKGTPGLNELMTIYFSDDFKSFAQEKPEYAPLFIAYQELKAADTNANMNGNRNSNAKTRLPVVIEEDNLGPSDNVQPAANHIKAE